MGMEVEQLLQFRMAARLNHLGRTAEALGVSQPAVSQSIRRLEKRYGIALFDRIGRTIRLNESGAVLLNHVERALLALGDADRAMRDLASSQPESIGLGYFGSRRAKAIPCLIRRFHATDTPVDFGIFRGSDSILFERLKEGSLDFCFTSRKSHDLDITSTPLWRERLFVYVSRNHPFASRREIDLRDLSDEPMVSLKKHTDFRAITDAICAKAGFSPRVVFEGQNVVTLHGLVAANIGVALAPELDGPEQEGVVALPVRSSCTRPIYASWVEHRSFSSVATRFRDFVLSSRTAMRSIGLEPFLRADNCP